MNPSTPLKFFANSCSFASQYTAMAYLKKTRPEAQKIVFIQIDDGNFGDIEPVAKATAEKLGLVIMGSMIGYTPNMVDMAPIVQKALALDPDAIMIGNGPTGFTAQILKGARVAGYTKPIFSCSNAPVQDILTIVGQEVATNYFGHGITIDYNIPNLPPLTKEIMQMAEKEFGIFNFEQTHGFNAVYTLAQAIETAQSLDPKEVAAAWDKMDTIDTIYGEGKMGGLETYGIKHNVYFPKPIMELQDGKIVFGDWIPVYMP